MILPPGYKNKLPDGCIAVPSSTYAGYAILSSNLKGGGNDDIAEAVTLWRACEILSALTAANPQPIFMDAIDMVFDSTIPYEQRFFDPRPLRPA